jgi:hypothetical protein
MIRLLLALAALVIAAPLYSQPVPAGDEIRVRENKKAPWMSGLYAGHDSTSLIITEGGIERVYELMVVQRVEWFRPRNVVPELLLGIAVGALGGIAVEALRQVDCYADDSDCNENWGKAVGIGMAAGAGFTLVTYAIWPRDWKNVTKHYPPAGTTQD